MDITKRGWKCDSCGKEYLEGNIGYEAKYTVTIESHSNYNSYKNGTYIDVCDNCIDGIMEVLDPANIE